MTTVQSKPVEPKSTAKRDTLIATEQLIQHEWKHQHLFEVNVPENVNQKKFFVTCPYAYMNGRLHLGHCFTYSKGEFSASYERMKGKVALFPVGFHCTGMPIKACADKLAREVEMFGTHFENYSEVIESMKSLQLTDTSSTSTDATATKEEKEKEKEKDLNHLTSSITDGSKKIVKKHAKALAKSGAPSLYQFQIMQSLGVPLNQIHHFANPEYWLTYFPPLAQQDLSNLGFKIDWRRSFITTPSNPYYDRFIQWQFRKLKHFNKIKFGERYTIWSCLDQQPCMDHDRQSGEGVGPQEYVAVKLLWLSELSPSQCKLNLVLQSFKETMSNNNDGFVQVYLMAATLRPETLFGQTNCFVGTSLTYGMYEANEPNTFYVMTEHAAKNMAFQGLLKTKSAWPCVTSFLGQDLIGGAVKAPLTSYSHVYVLPLEHVVPNKGTGIVTSVPSDSPDDYAMLLDLKKKPDFYKIETHWVESYEPIPILSTPTFGTLSAQEAVKQFKIQSPKDRAKLDQAKEAVYKESYYSGIMLVKDYEGQSIESAKPKIKHHLIQEKLAVLYCEPEKEIVSRSGDICVVSLCDQWYLDYGEPEWRHQTLKLVDTLETFHLETKHVLQHTLNWLNQWACARSFGLGTLLPWDPQFVIESLSDSTIYMAYYTICHYLHSDMYGQHVGPFNIRSDQMTDDVWEYIFNELAPLPSSTSCTIPIEHLKTLRHSFTYFYPLDLRTSGKDLVSNHLTFFLYNHTCLFDPKYWPKAIRANGHLLLNSEKMSKSSGNFMTVSEALTKFGADATRMAMADAGDAVEDANFMEATANAAILRLYTQRSWIQDVWPMVSSLRTGEYTFMDRIFYHQLLDLIVKTDQAYSNMLYREALKYGFYEFQDRRDFYRDFMSLTHCSMHQELVKLFIYYQVLMLTPITPHWCEYIWKHILNEPTTVINQPFPTPPANVTIETKYVAMGSYLSSLSHTLRTQDPTTKKPSVGHNKRKVCYVFVASKYPDWQLELLHYFQSYFQTNTEANSTTTEGTSTKEEDRAIDKDSRFDVFAFDSLKARFASLFQKNKKAMSFVNELKLQYLEKGTSAFQSELEFNEMVLLTLAQPWLCATLHLHDFILIDASLAPFNDTSSFAFSSSSSSSSLVNLKEANLKASLAVPGSPGFIFTFAPITETNNN